MLPLPPRSRRASVPRPALAGLVCVLMLGVCGAAPPMGEGTEVTVGVGFGSYEHQTGGCGGTRRKYAVSEPLAHLRVRNNRPSGVSWAGEVSIAPGRLASSRDEDAYFGSSDGLLEEDPTFWTGAVALRGGRHWQSFGFELGPAVVLHKDLGGLSPLPSGIAWVGRPAVAYAFADLVAGPFGGAYEFAALVGIGHRSRILGASFGTNGVAHVGDLDLRVGHGVRLGFNGAYGRRYDQQESPDLRGILHVTLDYGALSKPTREMP